MKLPPAVGLSPSASIRGGKHCGWEAESARSGGGEGQCCARGDAQQVGKPLTALPGFSLPQLYRPSFVPLGAATVPTMSAAYPGASLFLPMAQSVAVGPLGSSVPMAYYPVGPVYPPGSTVLVEGGFDAGARFGAGAAAPSIPVSMEMSSGGGGVGGEGGDVLPCLAEEQPPASLLGALLSLGRLWMEPCRWFWLTAGWGQGRERVCLHLGPVKATRFGLFLCHRGAVAGSCPPRTFHL